MRTLFCTAILLFTFCSISPAQKPFVYEQPLRTSSLSSVAEPGTANTATLFDPVPVASIPEDRVPSCAAQATSATIPSTPVAKPYSAVPTTVPNSDAPPVTYARLPIAPEPRANSPKRVVISNTVMYGATVFHAFGRQAEIDACKRESGVANGVYLRGSYKGMTPPTMAHFYAIALPIDAGVTLLSALAHAKGWRTFEVAAPLTAASAHITAGAFKFSSGCY